MNCLYHYFSMFTMSLCINSSKYFLKLFPILFFVSVGMTPVDVTENTLLQQTPNSELELLPPPRLSLRSRSSTSSLPETSVKYYKIPPSRCSSSDEDVALIHRPAPPDHSESLFSEEVMLDPSSESSQGNVSPVFTLNQTAKTYSRVPQPSCTVSSSTESSQVRLNLYFFVC